jgi:hypothetical protein
MTLNVPSDRFAKAINVGPAVVWMLIVRSILLVCTVDASLFAVLMDLVVAVQSVNHLCIVLVVIACQALLEILTIFASQFLKLRQFHLLLKIRQRIQLKNNVAKVRIANLVSSVLPAVVASPAVSQMNIVLLI